VGIDAAGVVNYLEESQNEKKKKKESIAGEEGGDQAKPPRQMRAELPEKAKGPSRFINESAT